MAKYIRHFVVALIALAVIGVSDSCAQFKVPANSVSSVGTSRTGDMREPRASHTATLLSDGRVLITGGFVSEERILSSAEMFDALRNAFSVAASMNAKRSSHTATLLPSGKVLIGGGFDGDYLASAELYDPATNIFTAVGRLTEPRSGHTAVLLKDGRVLLAGGVGTGWTFLGSAEIFDPATNSFSKTGSLSIGRESHVATLLPDGNVLIAGGHSGRRSNMRVFSEAEVFDPRTGKFSDAGEMTTKRHKHAAITMKDGRVVIVGGADERDSRGAYDSAEIYNSATHSFKAVGNMSQTRYKLQGTLVQLSDGKILIAGGASKAELFDPRTDSFSPVAGNMDDVKLFSAATVLRNGSVLITGGYNHRVDVSDSAWVIKL